MTELSRRIEPFLGNAIHRMQNEAPISNAPTVNRLVALTHTDLRLVDDIIQNRMQSHVGLIPVLAGHLVGSGGKRLRPMLTVACAKLAGYNGTLHHSLAAAIELLHSATLLHDDVVDGSELRRGLQTANMVWGNRVTIFVGDFLLAQCFDLIIETHSLRALKLLSDVTAVMAQGEIDQLSVIGRLECSEATYYEVIDAKTADLFAVSCRMAAAIIAPDNHHDAAFDAYGRNLGLAFQLVDDALDYTSTDTVMGKSQGDDFREGKITLPVILSYKNGDETARSFWLKTMSDRNCIDDAALAEALVHMRTSGAVEETLTHARQYAEKAKHALNEFPDTEIKMALIEAADFSVARRS